MGADDRSVYKVSRCIDFYIGVGSAVALVISMVALLYFGNESGEIRPVVGIVCLLVVSAFFITSYFMVDTIILTNDKIIFQPCNYEIFLSEIDFIKNTADFRIDSAAKCPRRIELVTNVNRLRWMPLNTLWIGEAILIRTYGFSASSFAEELQSKLS